MADRRPHPATMLITFVLVACSSTPSPAEPPGGSFETAERAVCPWSSVDDLLLEGLSAFSASGEVLAPIEVAEDLACLRRALEHQYVATMFYREHGVDLVERLDELAARTEGPLEPIALLERLMAVHDGAFDRHLGYALDWTEDGAPRTEARAHPYLWPYRLEGEFEPTAAGFRRADPAVVIHECDGLDPLEAIVDERGRAAIVFIGQLETAPGLPPRRVECRAADDEVVSLEAFAVPPTGGPAGGSLNYERDGDHLQVRLPQMDSDEATKQREILELLRAEDGPSTVLFDLRNNGGGDDEFAYRLSAALRSRAQPVPETRATDLVSLHALAASITLARRHGLNAAAHQLEEKLAELEAQGRRFDDPPVLQVEAEALTDGMPTHGDRDAPYAGRVVLLVNKACASSCESMVELLADLDGVMVLGTHTMGAVAFGNIGVSVLPHSKIQFVGGWRYFGNVEVEGWGYAPDRYVLAEDPHAAAMSMLHPL